MTKRDWLIVGLKLLGVYFAVQGVVSTATIASTYFQMFVNDSSGPMNFGRGPGGGIPMRFFLGPIITLFAYFLAAFFLVRQTKFCMLFVYPWSERDEVEATHP